MKTNAYVVKGRRNPYVRRRHRFSYRAKLNPIGFINEFRFFRIVTGFSMPSWLIRIGVASHEDDVYNDTDAIAYVKGFGKVPIQIKSSEKDARNLRAIKCVNIVVNRHLDDDEIAIETILSVWEYVTISRMET